MADKYDERARELKESRATPGDPMTLHDRARKLAPCTCLPDYKLRNRDDPQCFWCQHGEDMVSLARDFASDALYEFCDIIDASGTQRGELAAAIAAAEKGESK